jgi:hypothetical protein
LVKYFILSLVDIIKLKINVLNSYAIDGELKVNYKELEGKLQKALSACDKAVTDKHQLQIQYEDCQKQCRGFVNELEKLEDSLKEKSQDLLVLNKKMQSRLFFCFAFIIPKDFNNLFMLLKYLTKFLTHINLT